MAVDEPRYDRHPAGVERLGSFGDQRSDIRVASHSGEPAALDRERLSFRGAGINRVDPGVEHHEIGVGPFGGSRSVRPGYTKDACEGRSGQAHELSTAVALISRHWSSSRAAKNCIRTKAQL